jgi:hypothetical protein
MRPGAVGLLDQTDGLWDSGFSPRRSEESEGREESQLIAFSSLPSFLRFFAVKKRPNVVCFDFAEG